MVQISSGGVSENPNLNQSQIFMAFDQKVKVEAIIVDKFEVLGALNFLGSNMGLLPGMGLYQLLELSIIIIFSYIELFKRREERN